MTLQDFIGGVEDTQRTNPKWRYGQTVFNVLLTTHPEYAEELRGTARDPFFKDDLAAEVISEAVRRGLLT